MYEFKSNNNGDVMNENKKEKEKIRKAAALQYNPMDDEAPRIIAMGKGDIAEKIIEAAGENNVPVYQDANLAQVLNSMNIGDEIPRELYGIVSEILVFISSLDRDYGEKYGIEPHE